MPRLIVSAALDFLFQTDSTFALVDVREFGEYNTAHIPGASSLPRRLLEFRFERLVPCRSVQVILCDDDGRRASLAAQTIERAGYNRVAVLDGGLNRWATDGFETEWGMNVVSKDFGERVEVSAHVPTIEPLELERRLREGEKLVILDTRTPEEFSRACIPGGRSVPGGELALRVTDIVREQPSASVVVNCAGRTRSIIGARTLQRMGVPNVVSLRNGTSGWTLAGLELEHGATHLELPAPSEEGRSAAEAFGLRVAAEDGVRLLDIDQLEQRMSSAGDEATYLIDVRTREEYESGHIPGFWWFPGGQAVQRADDVAAVRNGHVVFCCDGVARSTVAGSWYRQMGFLTLDDLHQLLAGDEKPPVIFLDPSDQFASGHIAGSHWLSRSWLEMEIGEIAPDNSRPVVLTDSDGRGALLGAMTLREAGYERASALEGGLRAWHAAGLPLERGLTGVMQPPADVVAAGTDRTYADMVHYLSWEEALGRKYLAE